MVGLQVIIRLLVVHYLERIIQRILTSHGCYLISWQPVLIDRSALGFDKCSDRGSLSIGSIA
jgi:hypothetical protein